jgi:hypothetical protein
MAEGFDTYKIITPFVTVKVEICRVMNEVTFASPMIRFMKGWHIGEVEDYCWKKRWKLEQLDTSSQEESHGRS